MNEDLVPKIAESISRLDKAESILSLVKNALSERVPALNDQLTKAGGKAVNR